MQNLGAERIIALKRTIFLIGISSVDIKILYAFTTRMTQWGSKYLGDQGYSFIEILRYYYGSSMYVNEADEIAGIPASWPRENLQVGSRGEKVRQMQAQLARISRAYPAIPTIAADGVFGPRTEAAVEEFQSVFGLPVTGVVDYPTWYKISEIYVGVTRIAELYP
ncbi:MAG: peptidoglycan-binding protein [Lachnospiraceae bacterium]|nr:peptidoglycan-binding protein [Lachnospiraceae bacterium]